MYSPVFRASKQQFYINFVFLVKDSKLNKNIANLEVGRLAHSFYMENEKYNTNFHLLGNHYCI